MLGSIVNMFFLGSKSNETLDSVVEGRLEFATRLLKAKNIPLVCYFDGGSDRPNGFLRGHKHR